MARAGQPHLQMGRQVGASRPLSTDGQAGGCLQAPTTASQALAAPPPLVIGPDSPGGCELTCWGQQCVLYRPYSPLLASVVLELVCPKQRRHIAFLNVFTDSAVPPGG